MFRQERYERSRLGEALTVRAYRYISGFMAWYPGFKPPSPRPLPAPLATWFNIDFGGGLGVRGIMNYEL